MPKYSYLFKDDPNNKQYLFVSSLGSGRYNRVQLVKDTSTGNLLVRKVAKHQHSGPHPPTTPNKEVEITQRLRSFPLPRSSTTPKLAHLITSHDLPVPIPAPQDSSSSKQSTPKYARISYWTLYNGGTLTQLLAPRIRRAYDEPAVYPIPYALIARFIWQTCETLQFMYGGSPDEMVFHCDLHGGNIFLHWGDLETENQYALPDFYVGDFGGSKSIRVPTPRAFDHQRNIPWPWDVSCSGLLRCLRGLIDAARLAGSAGDPRDVEIERLRKRLYSLNVEDLKRNPDFAPLVFKGWAARMPLLSLTDSTTMGISLADAIAGNGSSWQGTGCSNVSGIMSRPPDLNEVIRRAKELEWLFTSQGEMDERGTEVYRGFVRRGGEAARELVGREPFVFELKTGRMTLGSWGKVGSSGGFVPMDIPSPWYVARVLEEEGDWSDGDQEGSVMYRCCIVGDETGYTGSGTRCS